MKRFLLPALLSALMIAEVHAESFTVSDIRVNGLQRVSAGSVFAALPLNVGETIDDQALVQATRSLFKTGFFQDIQLGRDGNVLVVTVVERPSISSIEIEGNKAISKEDLLKGLKQSGLAEGEIFQRATLEGVRNELQRQYVAQGRYSAEINAEVIPQPRNRVALKININEGTVAAISHINVVGNTVFSEEDLTDLFELMTTTSDLITRRLGNEGYTFANVNGVPEAHDDDKTVSVTFVVDPGKRAYVNRINFRGNTKTEDEVLRREMRQMEGGWASTYLIDQSKARLERLGYFKEVNVETPAVPGTDDQVDVNYSVEEQPSGSITASVGFAQSAGLILGGSISQNNFLGTGNKVSIGLTRSEYQTRYNFGFVDPYWTVDGVSLGYNAFYRKTDYDELDVDVASYSVNSLGAGMSIGYPISETSRLTYGLSVQRDQIDTGRYTVDEIYDFLDKEGDNFTNFKASIGWSESTLNKGVLATRGHSQSLTLETTLPGSDLSFYKIDYRGQVFAPLTDNYTMRFHTELGYGDGYGSTERLPFYENYYAGGFNSVRGFKDSTLGPRSTPSVARNPDGTPMKNQGPDSKGRYTDPDQDPEAFGGNILITGGAELLFPLPFVKDQRQLRTVLFWDVGSTFDTDCPTKTTTNCDGIKTDNLASSVGVGLTWITALGPLSFSLATPIKKPDNAETQVFQFSLGQTF